MDQTKFPKYLDSLLFPWMSQTLQALTGNFFLSTCWHMHKFMLLHITWQALGWDFMRCIHCTPRSRAGQICLWRTFNMVMLSSLLPLIAEAVYTYFFFLWIEGIAYPKRIENSTVYKVQHYFLYVRFIIFLRVEQHERNLSAWSTPFMWLLSSLMQAGFTIFSPIFLFFPVGGAEVSWIIDIIRTTICLSMLGKEYHLF